MSCGFASGRPAGPRRVLVFVVSGGPILRGLLLDALAGVLGVPAAWHHVEQYADNPIEADHGRLKQRLRPMRGLRTDRTAQVVIVGHAFVQNLRRGHYELGLDTHPALWTAAAFTELSRAI